MDDEYAHWRCPRCDVAIMGLSSRAGEDCFFCEADLAWARLPAPVRDEIDDLLRGDLVLRAIIALRERSGAGLAFAKGLVLHRRDVLHKQGLDTQA